jgi:hypothetical protein
MVYNVHFAINFLQGMASARNIKGGSITVLLTSCLTGLDLSVLQIKTKIVSCHTAYSKPVKQEVNGTVILPPLVFHGFSMVIFGWGEKLSLKNDRETIITKGQ